VAYEPKTFPKYKVGSIRGQGEKLSVYVKLGTSGRWIGTWTEAGVTATLRV